MLGTRKVIVDSFCELKAFTGAFEDEQFWGLHQHDIVPDAIYIISRQQFNTHRDLICKAIEDKNIVPVFGNSAEGSETMYTQLQALRLLDLVRDRKIGVVTGGHMQPDVPYLFYEHFLPKILDFEENRQAMKQYYNDWSDQRPYKFLFLNGRSRPHRRELIAALTPLLNQSLWTNLDATHGQPLQYLPAEYEFDFYQHRVGQAHSGFAKYELFNNDWGEIYINPLAYQHTYFSLVSETVFYYPHSFRTEKIWKPIAMGQPFVAAANVRFYRDLHDLGFLTFDNVIDESFDSVEDNQQRLQRIVATVQELCASDLAAFARDTRKRCIYNQQRFRELSVQVKAEFPYRLETYLKQFCQ